MNAPVTQPLAPPQAQKGWLNLSPINRRRLDNFKANKRGYWSFWIFMVLFVLAMFAEFIANDRPIMVSFKGEILFPIFQDYPEDKFIDDGFLPLADYREPLIADAIDEHGWAIWPPIRFHYTTHNLSLPVPAPSPPTWMLDDAQCEPVAMLSGGSTCRDLEWNWLGTDDQSRDVLARLIYGFRISVLFGLILAGVSSVIGVFAGAVQGYFGGWTDLIFQRFIEIWTAIPALYLLIIIASIITPTFWVLLGILLLFSWVALVGVVRAEFLRARNFEYVRAACALGVSNTVIMFRHVLPNAMVATLTFLPFTVTGVIGGLAALDFLGFGLPSSAPSLGELTLQARNNLQAPWLGFSAFFSFAIMLSLLVFIFEGVRDAFDPRQTFR